MVQHTNFFETVKESWIRLRNSVVLYDGNPVVVIAISDHMKDGIFRCYIQPLEKYATERNPSPLDEIPYDHPSFGKAMDDWLEANKHSSVQRKMMNSPLFNKFRPFPLGMMNIGGGINYLERSPIRPKTEQGLISSAVMTYIPQASGGPSRPHPGGISQRKFFSEAMANTIKGIYPTAGDCLKNLLDPGIENEAAAFHRDFALARGPLGMLFLVYKKDFVGVLPNCDLSQVRVGKQFHYTKESIEELGIFDAVVNA